MRHYFKNIFRIKSTFALMFLSFFCIFLSVCRIFIAENYFLLFLVWNLFLAFVPWLISSTLYLSKNNNKIIFIIFMTIWLLFFPNALYIVTDFIHLKTAASTMRWYDLILLFSYSFAGLFYGFVSLDPFIHARTWAFILLLGTLFNLLYISYKSFGEKKI